MPSSLMTPGVYIQEKNAFPNSAVAVSTSVPAFIGYTEIAVRTSAKTISLLNKAVRIASFAEYNEFFGKGFSACFTVNADKSVQINEDNTFYLYNAIRLFYANGGGDCYIVSTGTYGDKPGGFAINAADITAGIDVLKDEMEPTMLVMPDAIALGPDCYTSVYRHALEHCGMMQNRIAILDLVKPDAESDIDKVVSTFRAAIENNYLSYGAAYYPWLQATIVQADEVTFENLDSSVDLANLLPEPEAQHVITKYESLDSVTANDMRNYHLSLKATSPVYNKILQAILLHVNTLPPSGAMAGIYTQVDNSRGVWKAPANISLSMVSKPDIVISHDMQEKLNVDAVSGKSINVIRPFPGIGTLVWGARTLDGNSQDWRYINVRRTLIMIEQSIKQAARAYVFEPNDGNTWVTVKSMINNFLFNLWKQGALAGAVPEQAYDVQIGLGSTMTPTDILDGRMLITVKVAIVRPADFIVITFQQQMQQS